MNKSFLESKFKKMSKMEIENIKSIYDKLIAKEGKLNSTFGFKNPVQIYALFSYLLFNGYLFFDRNKNIEVANIINWSDLRTTQIMLNDIFQNEGIASAILNVYKQEYTGRIVSSEHPKHFFQQEVLIDKVNTYISDLKKRNKLLEYITCHPYEDFDIELVDKKFQIFKRLYGNKSINMATKNDFNYFFDINFKDDGIITSMTWRKDLLRGYNDLIAMYLCMFRLCDKNSSLTKLQIIEYLINDSQDVNFQINMYQETMKIIKQNLDLLQSFYKENKELYWEISQSLSLMKK